MNKAKEELGKSLMTLANLLLVLFLLNTYLQKSDFSFWIIPLVVYAVASLYWIGFNLIKESNE